MRENNMPLISVIIPVYRIEDDFLIQCIDSVLSQRIEDIEVILVNDGSTQNNVDICKRYVKKDSRVVFLSHENRGVSVCRNEGIEIAKGKWIAFIDSDDWVEPDYLKVLLSVGEETQADIVLCDCFVNYAKSQIQNRFFRDDYLNSDIEGKDRFFMQFLCSKYFGDCFGSTDSGAPWGKLYRKSLIYEKKLRFCTELRRMQDNVFNLYAYENADRIIYFHRPLYHYRKSISSGFSRYNPDIVEIYYLVFASIEAFLKETHKEEMYWQAFYSKIVFSFYTLLKLDFANKQNPQSYLIRKQRAMSVLKSKWYVTALNNGDSTYRTRIENLFSRVMKIKFVDGLFLMYNCKEIIWKLRGRGIE